MNAPPIQYVTTHDGYRIAYTVCGEGPPLVLMPGPLNHLRLQWSHSGMFPVLCERLAASTTLICYDSRGQGMSTRGLGDDFKIDDFEIDLDAVVDELHFERFLLMGLHGFGRVAVKYAEHRPERLMGLILWNTSTGEPSLDTRLDPSHFEDLARDDWESFVEAMARITWAADDPPHARAMVRESVTQADWLTRAHAWSDFNVAHLLPNLNVRTLVMAPSTETYPLARVQTSKNVAARIPGARLAIYDDPGGLLSIEEDPPPAVVLIRDFVTEIEAQQRGN